MVLLEFRIVMPLSLEEYQRGQLYMVAKISRQASKPGEGVEVIVNEPYSDAATGASGQFTKKIYHLGSKVPALVEAIAPADALKLVETAYNLYPFCKTEVSCPFLEKFSVQIRTLHSDDLGLDNALQLTSAELSERQVIDIDIASDEVAADKYRACEDPTLVASAKTQRGPLDRLHWRENARRAQQPLMCVYKVVRAEFRYFGMQSAIEGTIQRSQREMFLNGHRQLFAWMDEWIDLSVAQIREYERETVRLISAQMGTAAEASSPAPPSSSDSDANAANSADADESPVSLDPMVNGTEQWESLWRACGTFLPTLGRYDARTPALPVASSPSSLASSPLSRNNRGGSMFARGEQPPNVLSSAAWTMPLAIADASYQFDARSMIRSLNAWPQRIQFLHQCMQEGAMAEASRSLSLPLARRLIAGLIRDAPRLIRSVVPGASEGSNENACFSPSVTAAASVPSVPIVHSDSAQGGSGSDSGGTLHLQCHHAHASVTLPSLSVPALLAHVYAHFMAEDFNGSATKLFSAAQRAAIWQALPRPVPVRGAEPSVATSESDLHALKTSRRERLSRVLFEFTESVSINGRVVNRNHNGRRRGRYGRNLSLGDSGAGQRRAIHVSSADHAADAFVSGDDESDMTDERSSGSSSDNDEDNDDMEVEDEADTEEFWRWHPLLMRAMMQTTVELPICYWVFEVEVLHGDGRVERQLTRIDARTSSSTELAIGRASTDSAAAPTLLSVVGASLTALQSIPAALRDAATDSSARVPPSIRAAQESANPNAAASSTGTSSLASPTSCRASAALSPLKVSRESACFVAFETARADSSSSSESSNLRRVFETWTPPVFQRHPWIAASSSSSSFSLASTPTFATAAGTTLIAARSLPSSSSDALRWALTIKLPQSSSSSSFSSTGVRVRVFGVPDLRELLLPPPVDAESAPWMQPPLYASSDSSAASSAVSATSSFVHGSHLLSARDALLAASSSSQTRTAATTGRTSDLAARHRRRGANVDSSGASDDGDGSASDASEAASGGGGASNEDSSVFDGSFLDADLSDFETVAFMGVRRRGTSSSHPPLNPAALSSRRRQRASTAAVSGHIRSAVAGSHPSAAATATATRPPSSPAEWLAQRLDGDGDHSSGGLFPESIAHFFPLGALRIDGADLFDERMHTARLSNLSLPPPRSGVADTSAVAGNASHSSSSRKSSLDNTSSQHTTTAPASPFSVLVAAATVERAAELELSWQYSKPVDAIDASALRAHEIWRFVPPSMRAALGAATAVAANANASVTAIDGNARVAPTTTTMKTTTTIHARVCDEILDRPAVIMPRASSSLSLNFERTNRNGAERTNDSANDGDCDADDVDSDDDLDDFSVADLSTLVLLLLFVFQSLVGACDRLAAVVRTLRGGRRRRQQSATSHDTLVALLALLACAPALPSFTSVLASVSGFPLLAIFTLESWSGVHWMGALSATALTCGSYAWAMLQFAQRAAVSLLLFVVAHKCRPNAAAASASASASATGQLSSSLSISASLALDEASWVDRHQRLCRALRRPFGPDLSRGAQRPLRNLLRRFVRSLALLVAAAGRALPLPLFDWSDAAGAIGALSHVCLFAAVWSLAGLSLAPVVAALALWVFVRRSRAFVALVTFLRGVDRVLLRPYAHAAVEVYATTAAPAMGQLTNHY